MNIWGIIRDVTILAIFGEMILFILPDSSYEKYMRFLMELLLLCIVFSNLSRANALENVSVQLEQVWNMENNMDEFISKLDLEITNYYKKENSFEIEGLERN